MSSGNEQNDQDGKKRKIIHWSPDDVDRGEDQSVRKGRDWAFFLPVLIGVFIFGGLATFGLKHYLNPKGADAEQQQAEADGALGPDGRPVGDPVFVSRERLERMREKLKQDISAVRKVTDDHTVLIENLVNLETTFEEGVKRLSQGAYPAALAQFETVDRLIKEQGRLIALKQQVSTDYDRFLNMIEASETGRSLAPLEYEQAVAYGQDGEILFSQGEFTKAKESFKTAIEALEKLDKIVVNHMAERELAGKIALQNGEKEEAIKIFEEVLRLQPDNEFAQRNLKRAETIDIFLPLIESAKANENAGNLEEALLAYQQAFEVDSQSAKAQAGKSRVARKIRENRYKTFMSTAQAAQESGDWDTAIATYEEAVEAFPDREEIQEALDFAREEGRLAKIRAAMKAARAYEKDYNWEKAQDQYIIAYDLDAGNTEALDGIKRSGEVIRNLVRYDRYLEEAHTLAGRGEFQKAINFFDRAMGHKPSYLKLDAKTAELKQMLSEQSQPVTLRFISDGKTWVSITGQDMLGRFTERSVRIYPGNYRVRGRRKGYRDVILEVRVRYGRDLGEISVICNQPA